MEPTTVEAFEESTFVGVPRVMVVDETFVAARILDGLQEDDVALNQRAVRRAERIVEVVDLARRHPEIYTVGDGPDDADHARRSVFFDVAVRLQISENEVRSLECTASTAAECLPLLWEHARDGFVSLRFVEAAVSAVLRLRAPAGADASARAYANDAIALIDQTAAKWALRLPVSTFRRRVTILTDRLDPTPPERKHARGMVDRRVVVEDAGDGMSWLTALIPTVKAVAIKRRLTSTAKHLQKDRREGRTRDQVRADLLCDWLLGVGTDRAVKTTVFVTVPIGLLAGVNPGSAFGVAAGVAATTASAASSLSATGSPVASASEAQLVGHGPIDPATARQAFLDATGFRRVITDPVRGIVLDLDRRTYRPTKAQRDWLVLQHGTCARDGCDRLALDADLDHAQMWSRGGLTDTGNLRPLCPADHVRRHRTRMIYRNRENHTVQVITPTGFRTNDPPPF
ncbi:DUF222 domain-containing protein [Microbacterium sp. 22303]|uniref:HNH endonuclease signature motif containing protein n=1 Tax=Microbacterium sp. 22303 TaxID=3453905 RepID=UPI003F86372B